MKDGTTMRAAMPDKEICFLRSIHSFMTEDISVFIAGILRVNVGSLGLLEKATLITVFSIILTGSVGSVHNPW